MPHPHRDYRRNAALCHTQSLLLEHTFEERNMTQQWTTRKGSHHLTARERQDRSRTVAGRWRTVWRSMAAAATLLASALASPAVAADAPGAPGGSSSWTTGAKQGLGTSTTAQSKVWYTIARGVVTEVYFPQIDTANVQDLQLIVTDGSTFVDLERDATTHQVQLVDPKALTYRQINTATSNRYRITRTLVTDPDRPVLLMQTRFQVLSGGPYQVYVLHNPSLDGSGFGDTAATLGNALVASKGAIADALVSSVGFAQTSNGYSATASDGLVDLRANKHLTTQFDTASSPGNVVQIGQVSVGNDTTFTLALGFGASRTEAAANANASLAAGFTAVSSANANGWHAYINTLKPAPNSVTSNNLTTQYNVASMVLKALEDKTFPGAGIAGLATPWGDFVNADNCCAFNVGYQAVFGRDLYEVATAQLAAGDASAANRYLDFLLKFQKDDGSLPRNSQVNGTPLDGKIQLDEVSYPIILAWQLNRSDAVTWSKVRKAADFVVTNGPRTDRERWEENQGLSPSTIAAEIAGLVCAADIADKNGDTQSRDRYLATADNWQQNVENWTFTTTAQPGNKQYYIRIDDNQNPNDGDKLSIANGGGDKDERAIVDAGFLELVRLGVKPPNDTRVATSLPQVDATIKVSTPDGDMFKRYNFDGYGENFGNCNGFPAANNAGTGGLWPLLDGERGEYELANGNSAQAVERLKTMARAANAGSLIPEQVFDHTSAGCGFLIGQATGSAMPLAWSMAQFVRLAQSIDAGKPVETPAVVASRYGPVHVTLTVTVPVSTDGTGKSVFLAGDLDRLSPPQSSWNPGGARMTRTDATHWKITLSGGAGTTFGYKYVLGDWVFVEKGANCGELANRALTLAAGPSGTQSVSDSVADWRNVAPCGN
jgi:glucoamylase